MSVAILMVAALGAAPIESTSITVLPIVLDEVAKARVPDTFEEVILTSVQQAGEFKVTGRSDIIAILDHEAQKQLAGCTDELCMTELAGALGAEKLVSVSVSFIDGKWLVTAKLIVQATAEIETRVNKIVDGDTELLLMAAPAVIGELFGVEVETVGVMVRVSPSAESILNVHADVGGAVAYGPALALEMGRNLAGLVRARFLSLGFSTHLGAREVFNDETFQIGVGAGIGGRWYFSHAGNMRGPYVGAAAEYWYARVEDEKHDREAYVTHGLTSQVEAGYRWVFFGRFIVSAGGQVGYFKVLSQNTVDLSGGEDAILYEADGQDTPFVGVEAAVGYFF